MPTDLNRCVTIDRDQADILRGSTRIVRRDDQARGPADTTLIQAAHVPAAGVAALATTVQMRKRTKAVLGWWLWQVGLVVGAAVGGYLIGHYG